MQKYKVKKYPEEQASLASEYKIGRAKSNRVLSRECTGHSKLVITKDISTHGHHQMVNIEIRLIFFAAKDGEALYSQQKQDWELTVAQIMNSLLQNSDLN